jgi:uncharacterized protein YegL
MSYGDLFPNVNDPRGDLRIDSSKAVHRVWQFYVVCDVSESMWNENRWRNSVSPHEVMNNSLGLMLETLNDNHEAAAIGRIAIITFADTAQTHYPLSRIDAPGTLNPLPRGTWTNYKGVWDHLDRTIKNDIAQLKQNGFRPKQPVVFFITDGNAGSAQQAQAMSVWKPHHDSLTSRQFTERPRIVVLGMGDVNRETVLALRSIDPPGPACLAETGEPASTLLEAIISVIVKSIGLSATSGNFRFNTPRGMTRLDAR